MTNGNWKVFLVNEILVTFMIWQTIWISFWWISCVTQQQLLRKWFLFLHEYNREYFLTDLLCLNHFKTGLKLQCTIFGPMNQKLWTTWTTWTMWQNGPLEYLEITHFDFGDWMTNFPNWLFHLLHHFCIDYLNKQTSKYEGLQMWILRTSYLDCTLWWVSLNQLDFVAGDNL